MSEEQQTQAQIPVPPASTPDQQPGPTRTADGTIKDQSPGQMNGDQSPQSKSPTFLNQKDASKPDDQSTDKTPDGETQPTAPEGAPEKYEFKLPEGYKLDETTATEVSTLFKEMNLSQTQAQKLVDLYAKNNLAASKAPYEAWANLQKEWTDEIANRFGSRQETVKSTIAGVIDSVLPPTLAKNFRGALDLTGAGSNPDFVEAFYNFAKLLSEGTPVRGGGISSEANQRPASPAKGPVDVAAAMYPHLVGNRGQ